MPYSKKSSLSRSLKRVIECKNLEDFKKIIKKHPEVLDSVLEDEHPLLHYVVYCGWKEGVRYLLKHPDININSKDKMEHTPLHMAAWHQKEEIVEVLLCNRADPNIQDKYLETPAHVAAEKGDTAVLKLLLKHKTDICLLNDNGDSPLELALSARHLNTANVLLKNLIKSKSFDSQRFAKKVLYDAISSKDIIALEWILSENKPYINSIFFDELDNAYHTPLHLAVDANWQQGVNYLLQQDTASINLIDQAKQQTPLQIAIMHQNSAIVRELLKHKANPNVMDTAGSMPLHLAVEQNNYNVVEDLIMYKADLYAYDWSASSPLEIAIANQYLTIAKLIWDTAINQKNVSRIVNHIFSGKKQEALEWILHQNNTVERIEIGVSGIFGTLLHLAIDKGWVWGCEYIIDKDPLLIYGLTSNGLKPLEQAIYQKQWEMVKILSIKQLERDGYVGILPECNQLLSEYAQYQEGDSVWQSISQQLDPKAIQETQCSHCDQRILIQENNYLPCNAPNNTHILCKSCVRQYYSTEWAPNKQHFPCFIHDDDRGICNAFFDTNDLIRIAVPNASCNEPQYNSSTKSLTLLEKVVNRITNKLSEASYKKCPECHVPIQKTQDEISCNFLSCTTRSPNGGLCQGKVCDVCGSDVTRTKYNHFFMGDPGKHVNHDDLCEIYQKVDRKQQQSTAKLKVLIQIFKENNEVSKNTAFLEELNDRLTVMQIKPYTANEIKEARQLARQNHNEKDAEQKYYNQSDRSNFFGNSSRSTSGGISYRVVYRHP